MHQEVDSGGWPRRVDAILVGKFPDLTAYEEMAQLLVDLDNVMLSAPADVLTYYDTLSEGELQQWHYRWDRRLINAEPLALSLTDPRDYALLLGSLIRALDRLLLEHRPSLGPPADPEDWRIGDYYLIPRSKPSPWSTPKRNQGYRNRGLLHHRVVPTEIDELRVRLVILDTFEDNASRSRNRLGAAVFRDFDVNLSHDDATRFHVTGVNSADHALDIQEQLEASSRDECFIIVWPELTMPNTHRSKVSRILKNNILAEEPRVYPDIVVAGSWHELEDGARYNISQIYSRYGRPVATYKKCVAYSDDYHGVEDIKLGKEFPLIITETVVASFGVCKDFCTSSWPKNPYHEVKVDFVLVPSMGRVGTIQEHKTAANTLRNKTGGRVFIVQQHLPREDGVAAFVLPPNRRKDSDAIHIENGRIWESFTWD